MKLSPTQVRVYSKLLKENKKRDGLRCKREPAYPSRAGQKRVCFGSHPGWSGGVCFHRGLIAYSGRSMLRNPLDFRRVIQYN